MAPKTSTEDGTVCPVDDSTRQAWLDKARSQAAAAAAPDQNAPSSIGQSCDSTSLLQQSPQPRSQPSKVQTYFSLDHSQEISIPAAVRTPSSRPRVPAQHPSLDQEREISTIPRASAGPDALPSPSPANNEHESGPSQSGNWIYPSEQMFFDAMRRKRFDPQATDMRTIVPIHNAVNERAWKEIKRWEQGRGADACGGPKLLSFSGQSKALTPKARINSWLGYTPPFDRHDWVVDRCGTHVDYVIDFYAGRNDEGKSPAGLSFYLDVRPKLNSLEGWKMRLGNILGF